MHTWSVSPWYLTEVSLLNHALVSWPQVSLWDQKEAVLLNPSPHRIQEVLLKKSFATSPRQIPFEAPTGGLYLRFKFQEKGFTQYSPISHSPSPTFFFFFAVGNSESHSWSSHKSHRTLRHEHPIFSFSSWFGHLLWFAFLLRRHQEQRSDFLGLHSSSIFQNVKFRQFNSSKHHFSQLQNKDNSTNYTSYGWCKDQVRSIMTSCKNVYSVNVHVCFICKKKLWKET